MDEVFHAAPRMQNASHSHKLASVPTGQKRCARIAALHREHAGRRSRGVESSANERCQIGTSQDRSRAAG